MEEGDGDAGMDELLAGLAQGRRKPQAEVLEVNVDEQDRVAVEPRSTRKGKGKGKEGKGKEGKGKKNGKSKGSDRLELMASAGDEKPSRPREPKPRQADMGEALRKFERPDLGKPKGILENATGKKDKKLQGKLKKDRQNDTEAVFKLAKGQILQTAEVGFLEAEGSERTFKFTQAQIAESTTVGAASKRWALDLPYGPFACGWTSNGQHLLAGGTKGQIAMLHCESMNLVAEVQVKETVRAVQALHNHTMFATAQKKYVYIYDQKGIELHCLKDHKYTTHLEFLPYHFLLVTAGDFADLRYRDISTGQEVAAHRTKLGQCRALRQNPRTGVVHAGHSNGTVTLWTPKLKEPVVKMFCHAGHVTGLAVHNHYMFTSGADGLWKVWDLRKYDSIRAFKTFGHCATSIDVSMTGLVAVGYGSHLEVWKDSFASEHPVKPYVRNDYNGKAVHSLRFQPYEDVLAVGHSDGFQTLLVPGAGFANFDSFEANPYETRKQRREKEIRGLLEKLQPDTIMLDPGQIGTVDKKVANKYHEEQLEAKKQEEAADVTVKKKMRGKNKAGKRLKRKHLQEGKEQRAKASGRVGAESGGESSDEEDDDEDGATAQADAGTGTAPRRPAQAADATLGRFYNKRKRKT